MSTRCYIAKLNENGAVEFIYCHLDGYLEGVGQTLIDYYMDSNRVQELLKLGDLSSLHERLEADKGELHDFSNRAEGVTVAYSRDRGERQDCCCSRTVSSYERFFKKDCSEFDIEYAYLYIEDYGWVALEKHLGNDNLAQVYVCELFGSSKFINLTKLYSGKQGIIDLVHAIIKIKRG